MFDKIDNGYLDNDRESDPLLVKPVSAVRIMRLRIWEVCRHTHPSQHSAANLIVGKWQQNWGFLLCDVNIIEVDSQDWESAISKTPLILRDKEALLPLLCISTGFIGTDKYCLARITAYRDTISWLLTFIRGIGQRSSVQTADQARINVRISPCCPQHVL